MTPNFLSLWPGHVIRTMAEEHDVLLAALGELDRLAQTVAAAGSLGDDHRAQLGRIASLLLDAEPHHQREEQVLFPALEELGITGPPAVMRMEHEELRAMKQKLAALAEPGTACSPRALHLLAAALCESLGAHIQKENAILYPMALQHIDDQDEWADLRRACDAIGYCTFTPPMS